MKWITPKRWSIRYLETDAMPMPCPLGTSNFTDAGVVISAKEDLFASCLIDDVTDDI